MLLPTLMGLKASPVCDEPTDLPPYGSDHLMVLLMNINLQALELCGTI